MRARTGQTRERRSATGYRLALLGALGFACLQHGALISGCAPEHAQAQSAGACDCDFDDTACDQGCNCDLLCAPACAPGDLYSSCTCSCDTHQTQCDPDPQNPGKWCWCDKQCGQKSVVTGRIAARGLVLRKHGGPTSSDPNSHNGGITDPIDPTGSPTWVEYDLLGQRRNIGASTTHTSGNPESARDDASAQEMSVGDYNQLAVPLQDARQQPGSQVMDAAQYNAAQCRLNGQTVNASSVRQLKASTRGVIVNPSAESCNTFFRFESPLDANAVRVPTDQACGGGTLGPTNPPCRTVLVSQDSGKLLYQTAFEIGYESAFLAFDAKDFGGKIPTRCLPDGKPADAVTPDDHFVLDDKLYADALKARANGTPLPAGIPSDVLNMNLAEAIAFNDCRVGDMAPDQHLRVPSPIGGVRVELADPHVYHTDRTNTNGFYSIFYPTPVEYFDLDVNATLAFSAFNPRVSSSKYYYLTQSAGQSAFQDPEVSLPNALGGSSLVEILGQAAVSNSTTLLIAGSTPQSQANFPVDAAMLSVAAYVTNKGVVKGPENANPLQVGTDELVSVPQSADGKYNLELAYSTSPQVGPDDHVMHRGLLSSISVPDLRDSEIYVFRQADGYLIGSRWGLVDREVLNADPETVGCTNKACLLAVALIRGGGAGFTGVTEQKYNAGVNIAPVLSKDGKTQLKPGRFGIELDYGRNVNGPYRPQLRPGDRVKIILVNRATGYIGTALADYRSDSRGMSSFQSVGATQCGPIDQPSGAPCVIMRPPNLRVRAVRTTKIEQGANKGQEKQYVIGFEGSGLDTDKIITIETEWLDADGTPLPEGLPGFTGRLAKVVEGAQVPEAERVVVKAPNDGGVESVGLVGDQAALAAGSGGSGGGGGVSGGSGANLTGIDPALLAQCFAHDTDAGPKPAFCTDLTPQNGGESLTGLFPIRPGKNTSIIKLPQGDADRSHLYIHVDAQPMERNIDFLGRPEPAKPSFSLRNVCFSTCWADPDDPTSDRCAQTGVAVTEVGAGWSCVQRPIAASYKADGAVSDAATPFLERPSSYVPFLVPHFTGMVPPNSAAGVPQYEWEYRPEMQFSLFDLKVSEINVKGTSGAITNVANATSTLPAGTQDLAVKYALKEPVVGDLDRFEGERELAFSLGCIDAPGTPPDEKCGVVKTAKITNDGTAVVDLNTTDLATAFKADDLLTLRLIQNGDEGNVLWEYGFVDIAVKLTRDEVNVANIQIGAESPTKATAILQPPDATALQRVQWKIVDKSDGVQASWSPEVGPSTFINVPDGSEEGWIILEAKLVDPTSSDANGNPVSGPSTRIKIPVGCDCELCKTPGKCIQRVGSVDLTFSLGKTEGGLSAGDLYLKLDNLDEDSNKRRFLEVSEQDESMLVVRDFSGIRQVVAPSTFVQVDDLENGNGYELRFYERTVGNLAQLDEHGLYKLDLPDAGNHDVGAFAVWRIEGLGLAAGSAKVLRITEIRDEGTTTHISEYEQDTSGNWTLRQGGGLREEKLGTTRPDIFTRITTRTVSGPQGVPTVVRQKYHLMDWGEELVEEVRDPDGLNLTTTTAYYENPHDAGSYRKVHYRINPDGSWVSFTYDAQGRLDSETRPWLDFPSSPLGGGPTGGRVKRYSYQFVDGFDALGDPSLDPSLKSADVPRKVTESINGVQVSLTYRGIRRHSDGSRTEINERCPTPNATFGNGSCLRTETEYAATDPQNNATGGQVLSLKHPDGRLQTFVYEHGTWANEAFTVDSSGRAVRVTTIDGTTAHPDGVPYRSTKSVSVSDEQGNEVLQEHYAYVGSYELLDWTRSKYDAAGHLTDMLRSNGELETESWGCCQQNETTDSRGITTTLQDRDGLDRVTNSVRAGILTHYEYDAEGRQLEVTRSGGGKSLTASQSFDAAGRMASSTSEQQLTATYRYELNGLRTAVTRPGPSTAPFSEITEVTERYLDGQQKSTTGNRSVARYITYGVNGDGTQFTEVHAGSAGSSAFERTVTDMLGRTIRVERPGYNGTTEVTSTVYDTKGRIEHTSATGLADTLYEYDELGEQFRTVLDANGNGTIDLGGSGTDLSPSDRVSDSDTHFVQIGNDWWTETDQRVYASEQTSDAVITASTRTRLTGLGTGALDWSRRPGLVSEQVATDIEGNETRSTVSITPAEAKEEQRGVVPGSSIDALIIKQNDRVTSETSVTGVTTQYHYDGLGRRFEVVDSRNSNTSITHYEDLTGRVDYVEDAAHHRTTFTYDSNTGARTSQCNALSRCTYFDYSSRGELVRTWGDVAYPVEYVYDDVGLRKEMHTFRADLGWTSSQWPGGSSMAGDITIWVHEPATGLLLQKVDPDQKAVTYTYESAGRLKTRSWARGGGSLRTTYGYDQKTGELLTVDYSDSTPSVTYTYDRLGRSKTVTDGTGIRTFAYDPTLLRVESESVPGMAPAVLTQHYATTGVVGRPSGFSFGTWYDVDYGYDAVGRLGSVGWKIGNVQDTAVYGRVPQSDLLSGYTTSSGLWTGYKYEPDRDLKTEVKNVWGGTVTMQTDPVSHVTTPMLTGNGTVISQFDYGYDEIARRRSVLNTGTAFAANAFSKWGYDDRNQIAQSDRFVGTTLTNLSQPVSAEKRGFSYDAIGNRKTSTVATTQTTYNANKLNQYDTVGAVSPTYDDDGNLLADGTKTLVYNAENQLKSVTVPGVSVSTYDYDYMGRRIKKSVHVLDGSSPDYVVRSVYAGWNKIEEVRSVGDGNSVKDFVWGLDLSQSRDGAGGIGGLVASVSGPSEQLFTYDGNGNVSELISPSDGSVNAHYEYDAFGNAVLASGAGASENCYRFSTKDIDDETGLYYYGYRYYDSVSGRWVNKDPIGESGGLNLYGMTENSPVDQIDAFGHELYAIDGTGADEPGLSNVFEFYLGHYNGKKQYFAGIGSDTHAAETGIATWSAGSMGTGANAQVHTVMAAICADIGLDKSVMDRIDIVGWSRGAAVSLEVAFKLFGNGCCGRKNIPVRFIGLWDPVHSMGKPGVLALLSWPARLIGGSVWAQTNPHFTENHFWQGWDAKGFPPNVKYSAVIYAKDERRKFFRPTRLSNANETHYLPGVHASVGGWRGKDEWGKQRGDIAIQDFSLATMIYAAQKAGAPVTFGGMDLRLIWEDYRRGHWSVAHDDATSWLSDLPDENRHWALDEGD